jgi:hypothetical protein
VTPTEVRSALVDVRGALGVLIQELGAMEPGDALAALSKGDGPEGRRESADASGGRVGAAGPSADSSDGIKDPWALPAGVARLVEALGLELGMTPGAVLVFGVRLVAHAVQGRRAGGRRVALGDGVPLLPEPAR